MFGLSEILVLKIDEFVAEEYDEIKEMLTKKFGDRITEIKLDEEFW